MDWNRYLFSFEGRINRARFWLSLLVVLGWMLLLAWVIYFALLIAGPAGNRPIKIVFGLQATLALAVRALHGTLTRADLICLVGNVLGLTIPIWILLAGTIKRLHDRDRSGWWIIPFLVLPDISGNLTDWLGDSILVMPLGLAAIVLCVWGFFELSILRGSPRTNRFGPNPLGKQRATSGVNHVRGFNGSGRQQPIEAPFVPHKADAPPVTTPPEVRFIVSQGTRK